MDVSDLSIFISDYKQFDSRSICFNILHKYIQKGYKPSPQDVTNGSFKQICFGSIYILCQLWLDNLASQIKNLNNATEADWKEAVGNPGNIKLVLGKWFVWLG